MGDFNAKAGKEEAGDKVVGNYGIGCKNGRGGLLDFTEHNLHIMTTFFQKREGRSGRGRGRTGSIRMQ